MPVQVKHSQKKNENVANKTEMMSVPSKRASEQPCRSVVIAGGLFPAVFV